MHGTQRAIEDHLDRLHVHRQEAAQEAASRTAQLIAEREASRPVGVKDEAQGVAGDAVGANAA